jgi:hypothetical protein
MSVPKEDQQTVRLQLRSADAEFEYEGAEASLPADPKIVRAAAENLLAILAGRVDSSIAAASVPKRGPRSDGAVLDFVEFIRPTFDKPAIRQVVRAMYWFHLQRGDNPVSVNELLEKLRDIGGYVAPNLKKAVENAVTTKRLSRPAPGEVKITVSGIDMAKKYDVEVAE